MATKPISIETDAYELLAQEKKDRTESFSRVIRRLFAERPELTAGVPVLLLDSSFLIEFEDELASERPGPASALLAARRALPAAISIVTLGEFAEAFLDPVALNEFVSPFRILQLSRMIAWRAALLQTSLSRRLGENDAWIAATASWTDICEHVVGTNAPHRKSARAARSRPRLPQLQ